MTAAVEEVAACAAVADWLAVVDVVSAALDAVVADEAALLLARDAVAVVAAAPPQAVNASVAPILAAVARKARRRIGRKEGDDCIRGSFHCIRFCVFPVAGRLPAPDGRPHLV